MVYVTGSGRISLQMLIGNKGTFKKKKLTSQHIAQIICWSQSEADGVWSTPGQWRYVGTHTICQM